MSQVNIREIYEDNIVDLIIDYNDILQNSIIKFNDDALVLKSSCGFIDNGLLKTNSTEKQVIVTLKFAQPTNEVSCTISYIDKQGKFINYENLECSITENRIFNKNKIEVETMKTIGKDYTERQQFLTKNLTKRLSKWNFLINRCDDELVIKLLAKDTKPVVCAIGSTQHIELTKADFVFTVYPYNDRLIVPKEVVNRVKDERHKMACFEIVRADILRKDVFYKSIISNTI